MKLDALMSRLDKTAEKIDELQTSLVSTEPQLDREMLSQQAPIVVSSLADTKKPFDSYLRRFPRVKNYVAIFEDRFEALKYHAHDPGPVRNSFFWNFLWPPPRVVIRIPSIVFNPSRLDLAG